jgi:hypothetical protein
MRWASTKSTPIDRSHHLLGSVKWPNCVPLDLDRTVHLGSAKIKSKLNVVAYSGSGRRLRRTRWPRSGLVRGVTPGVSRFGEDVYANELVAENSLLRSASSVSSQKSAQTRRENNDRRRIFSPRLMQCEILIENIFSRCPRTRQREWTRKGRR